MQHAQQDTRRIQTKRTALVSHGSVGCSSVHVMAYQALRPVVRTILGETS